MNIPFCLLQLPRRIQNGMYIDVILSIWIGVATLTLLVLVIASLLNLHQSIRILRLLRQSFIVECKSHTSPCNLARIIPVDGNTITEAVPMTHIWTSPNSAIYLKNNNSQS